VKLRKGDPWMPAPAYGKSLTGLGVNLVVQDVAASMAFQTTVLGATVVYQDPDFAVVRLAGGDIMFHADHTYDHHAMHDRIGERRGDGVELRVHHTDPDKAEAAARAAGYQILSYAADKGHGLREAYIVDPDGYVWVPDRPV
jgi:catechol 2,3-dioxygenase-like lactoylglutathione lyase family enzyme